MIHNQIGGGNAIYSQPRNSAIELLRIVAMLLVLLTHYLPARMVPTVETINTDLWGTMLELELRSICFVCVNVFILISGYFGIKWKWRSFSHFIIQILFWMVFTTAIRACVDYESFRWTDFPMNILTVFRHWFVFCYLGLYMFAPVLNSYIEKVRTRDLGWFLVVFYVFSTFFGYFCYSAFGKPKDFQTGMSILSLMGLYLLGAYLRRQTSKWLDHKAGWFMMAYILLGFVLVAVAAALLKMGISSSPYGYMNPIVLLQSVCLFMFFARLRMGHVRWINYASSSAFAAYLLHCSPAIGGYITDSFVWIERTFSNSLPVALLYFCLIYVVAMLIDKAWWCIYNKVCKTIVC